MFKDHANLLECYFNTLLELMQFVCIFCCASSDCDFVWLFLRCFSCVTHHTHRFRCKLISCACSSDADKPNYMCLAPSKKMQLNPYPYPYIGSIVYSQKKYLRWNASGSASVWISLWIDPSEARKKFKSIDFGWVDKRERKKERKKLSPTNYTIKLNYHSVLCRPKAH